MKYGSLIGWGIVIYAVMFLAWNGLLLYGMTGTFARVALLAVLVITTAIAGRSLRLVSALDILPYSLAWMIVIALLDAIYSVPFAGWQVYNNWNLWVSYILVATIPLIAPATRRRSRERAV